MIEVHKIYGTPSRGLDCKFVAIDDKWGLKCYKNKYARDLCYDRQKHLAENEHAPPVGEKLDIMAPSSKVVEFYCYTTRVASVFGDYSLYKVYNRRVNPNDDLAGLFNAIQDFREEIQDFEEYEEYDVEDLHHHNLGFYSFTEGESKIVVIDTGFGMIGG